MAEALTIAPRWLDLKHAGRYSSMHRQTLLKHVDAGEIYGVLKGGKWFIDRLSIDTFFLADKLVVAKLARKGV